MLLKLRVGIRKEKCEQSVKIKGLFSFCFSWLTDRPRQFLSSFRNLKLTQIEQMFVDEVDEF